MNASQAERIDPTDDTAPADERLTVRGFESPLYLRERARAAVERARLMRRIEAVGMLTVMAEMAWLGVALAGAL